MANAFSNTLRVNEWDAALFNAYKIMGTKSNLDDLDMSLVSKVTEEGGKYQDKNQYSFINVVSTREWDPTDTNNFAFEERPEIKQQEIPVRNKRQIAITKSFFLDKRSWGTEGSYGQYIGLVDSQVSKAKKVYDQKFVNVGIGNLHSNVGSQRQTVKLYEAAPDALPKDIEAINRMNASLIAEKVTHIKNLLRDPNSDFNDIGFLDSYGDSMLDVVWNEDFLTKIHMLDLPTVYNDKFFNFTGIQLLGKYHGDGALTTTATADGTTHRAFNEYKIPVKANGEYQAPSSGSYPAGTTYKVVRPGDILPKGTPIVAAGTELTTSSLTYSYQIWGKPVNVTVTAYNTVHAYVANPKKICSILCLGDGVKFISSFQSDGSFQNYKSNTENIYSTFLFSDVEYLGGYPCVTLYAE